MHPFIGYMFKCQQVMPLVAIALHQKRDHWAAVPPEDSLYEIVLNLWESSIILRKLNDVVSVLQDWLYRNPPVNAVCSTGKFFRAGISSSYCNDVCFFAPQRFASSCYRWSF
jgi:hypothetical protein